MTFERNLDRLEQIVAELEGDAVDLDRALQLFGEGIECLRSASAELDRADAQLKRLVEHDDGSFELLDLEDE